MKTPLTLMLRVGFLVSLSCSGLSMGLFAQGFSVNWFTLEGGGSSAGGVYSVQATSGQADAGLLSGGVYRIEGGFWVGSEASPAPAPRLSISLNGNQATISWSPDSPGFVLQTSASLFPAIWEDASSAGANPVTVPTDSTRFYRLIRAP